MKRLLKNSSLVALGLVIGFVFSSFASNETITAVRDNITSIFVKGEQIKISSEDTPINYKNRLYVPLRLLSEKVGLVVDYDKNNKSVYISEKTLTEEEKLSKYKQIYNEAMADFEKEKAKIIEEAKKEAISKESKTDYRSLPILFKKDKFLMTLTNAVKTNSLHHSQFYFNVKNENEIGIVVDPFSAKFVYLDSNENEVQIDVSYIGISDINAKLLSSLDQNFDDTVFLTLNEIPKEVREGTLSFNIYPVGNNKDITKVVMPIKLD